MDFEKGFGDLALEIIANEDEVIPESIGGNLSYFNSSTENEFDIRKIKVSEQETKMIIEQVMGCPTTTGTIGVNMGKTVVGKKKKRKIKEQGKDHIAKDLNLFYKLKSKKLPFKKRNSMVNTLIKRDKKIKEAKLSGSTRAYKKIHRDGQKQFSKGSRSINQVDREYRAFNVIPQNSKRTSDRAAAGYWGKKQARFLRAVDKLKNKKYGKGTHESYSHIKSFLSEGSFGIKRLERVRNSRRRKGQDFKSSEKRFQAKAYPDGKNLEKLARNKLIKYKIKEGSQGKKRFLRITKKLGDKGHGDSWLNYAKSFLGARPDKLRLKAEKLRKARQASWGRRSIPSKEGAAFEFRQKRRAQGYKTNDN